MSKLHHLTLVLMATTLTADGGEKPEHHGDVVPRGKESEALLEQREAHEENDRSDGRRVDDGSDQRHEAEPGQEKVQDSVDEAVRAITIGRHRGRRYQHHLSLATNNAVGIGGRMVFGRKKGSGGVCCIRVNTYVFWEKYELQSIVGGEDRYTISLLPQPATHECTQVSPPS